ncbi:MAG: tetratricopeptide repeat protein, partial [bacterium]
MSNKNLKCFEFVLIGVILMSMGFGCAKARSMRRAMSQDLQGEDLFTTAEWFFNKGELEKAKAFYEKYLSSEPGSLQADNALFRLGEIAMARGDFIKSLELFQELPNRFPGSELIPSARFQAARSLYLNLSWDSAMHALKRFQEDFPVSQYNPEVMLILADIFIKIREYAKAKEEIISFLNLFPESSLKHRALYLFGLSEMYLGETEEAINHLTISLTGKLPDDKRQDALYALGTLSLMKNDLLTAVEYFSDLVKSLETGERKERIQKKVGDLIRERLNEDDLKAIIQRHPTDFPGDLAMMEMAERKFDQGELFDARYYLEMVVSGFPEHPEIPYIKKKLSTFDEKHDEGRIVRKFGCIAPLTGPLSGYGEK